MSTPESDRLEVGPNGRLNIQELKDRLTFPSEKWFLDGGGRFPIYMWFIGPDAMDDKEIMEIHRGATGRAPYKFDKIYRQGSFYNMPIESGEVLYMVELSPGNTDLREIQKLINGLNEGLKKFLVKEEPSPGPQANRDPDTVNVKRRSFWKAFRGFFKSD